MSPIESQRMMLGKMTEMQQLAASDRIEPNLIPNSDVSISEDFKFVVRSINEQQNIAGDMMKAVDTGQSEDVVGAMVASQKASLSFSMLMEMRNKVLNGIDDVMRMSL
ncbi:MULTISPECIES: flagellar hook-basal body complex protein FliE [Pseudoalteromonas]|jgi:flagellar hook-basal body complex protein FliE|nr:MULTISPECIES: flagellar hook-basal body complex protein FliE [Pseudoalteromonas]MBB1387123.1 flagellar hook-basal body complex protein FliE [Pseudoalteromonas sp. SG45-5]MBB1395226.1 flagellar hook-basal body complex protein FliE [Pseudoalteromonas sp. SG44-4]MBB1447254.1 flagellar hook-basal body complex protein FliE [Pseudoalteromonas sp. SG41-6]